MNSFIQNKFGKGYQIGSRRLVLPEPWIYNICFRLYQKLQIRL